MLYRKPGKIDVEISIMGIGGHEFLPDGEMKGYSADFGLAVTPGHIFDGFGGEKRKAIISEAVDHGINFFDATMDTEKEALGRNLQEIAPPYEIYIQTRPEGMVYGYDPYNQKMTNYELLKAEVQRSPKILKRDRIDFLNFGIMRSALEHDPDYLKKIADNISALKSEGLILFACADTFSGQSTYLKEIESGCFDALFISFSPIDSWPKQQVLPAAKEKGMGVITREVFMKGRWFAMGNEAGITDRNRLAQLAIKWNLSHEAVTTVAVGMDNVEQLRSNIEILKDPSLNEDDMAILEKVQGTSLYEKVHMQREKAFMQ